MSILIGNVYSCRAELSPTICTFGIRTTGILLPSLFYHFRTILFVSNGLSRERVGNTLVKKIQQNNSSFGKIYHTIIFFKKFKNTHLTVFHGENRRQLKKESE